MRKRFKGSKKRWENEWWEKKTDEFKAAQEKHDSRKMHKISKDIGVRC